MEKPKQNMVSQEEINFKLVSQRREIALAKVRQASEELKYAEMEYELALSMFQNKQAEIKNDMDNDKK